MIHYRRMAGQNPEPFAETIGPPCETQVIYNKEAPAKDACQKCPQILVLLQFFVRLLP
jgi:hypothetical protein